MADKDINVSVSSSGVVSVDRPSVELKKGLDQAKWNVSVTGLEKMTITNKADGAVIASCSGNGSSQACSCKSKTFDAVGTVSYMVTVRVSGVDHELDPDLIIKP
ncbi:MAG: hypothetical protein QOH21_1162 [Acidobacteriota bacterium]|jgi:hypothetical protein|nr:hypothetical protein [Acidobacteriota bacterium]